VTEEERAMAPSMRRTVKALERIADSLDVIIDRRKKTLRMVDVERGNVYKTHLGKNLRSSAKSADKQKRGAR
jgi:hypothetical protein